MGRHCERIVALLLPSSSLHFEGVQMQSCRDALLAPRLAHSARVATIAALLVALLYVGVILPFDVLDARHLIAQVDARLAHRLHYVTELGPPGAAAYDHLPVGDDVDTRSSGVLAGQRPWGRCRSRWCLLLSPGAWSRSGQPTNAAVGSGDFRLIAARVRARLAGGRREPGRG